MDGHFFLVGIRKIHRNALICMAQERSGLSRKLPPPQNTL